MTHDGKMAISMNYFLLQYAYVIIEFSVIYHYDKNKKAAKKKLWHKIIVFIKNKIKANASQTMIVALLDYNYR